MVTAKLKKSVYTGAVLLHVLAWVLTLIGIATLNHWCSDNNSFPATVELLAPIVGKDCDKLFRFAWLVWALNAIPVLLSVAAVVKPTLCRGGATTLWSVLATLNILLANSFNNLRDKNLESDSVDNRTKLALAGFAIMAATALLLILLDGLLVETVTTHITSRVVGGKLHQTTNDPHRPVTQVELDNVAVHQT